MEKGGPMILPTAITRERSQPKDDMQVDPSLPVGSTSKTHIPQADGQFWKQADSGQEWTQSSTSSTYWRPRVRHEKYYSSVAGDTSEASTTMHNLGSINESEGDAVRAWSDKPTPRW